MLAYLTVTPDRVSRGPRPLVGDEALLAMIREVIRTTPFAGKGGCKVTARLRRKRDIRVGRNRVLRLMLRAGLRVSEVQRLHVEECVFAQHARQRSRLRVQGKGRRERMVYLATDAEAALLDWLAVRPATAGPRVFTNRWGQPITVTGIELQVAAYGHRVGLRVSCHQLRHTFARQLIEVGTPVTTVQRLLGHRSLRSTQRYLSLADPIVHRDYDAAMARLLAPVVEERQA